MSRATSLLVALALASMTGCTLVGSVHPLSDAKTSIADDRLVGEWISLDPKTREPSNDERLTIRRAAEGVAAEGVAYEGINPNQGEQPAFFTTKIGEHHFISVAGKEEDGDVRYLILQYELRDDQLRMFLMHPDKTATAIAEGRIDGTVVREAPPPEDPNAKTKLKEVTLTATSEQLRKFFASKMGQAVVYTDEPAMLLKRAPK